MYELLLPIIAIIISVLSVIFVVFKEGIGLSLKFRESEETQTKRERIANVLNEKLKRSVLVFLKENRSKEDIDDDMMDDIIELARKEYQSNLGNDLLEAMTYYSNQFLRRIGATLFVTAMTILYLIVYQGIVSDLTYYIFSIFFVVFVLIACYQVYSNAKRYYHVREAFLRLSEEPNFDNSKDIDEDLEEKGISI